MDPSGLLAPRISALPFVEVGEVQNVLSRYPIRPAAHIGEYESMNRLFARMYLWWNGICPTHGCAKVPYCNSPQDIYMLCPECEREAERRVSLRIEKAQRTL